MSFETVAKCVFRRRVSKFFRLGSLNIFARFVRFDFGAFSSVFVHTLQELHFCSVVLTKQPVSKTSVSRSLSLFSRRQMHSVHCVVL